MNDPSDALARFMSKIEIQPDGCWLWTASVSPKGYGWFRADGRAVRAHRWAYKALRGDLTASQHLDHVCHDASLCRPPAACQHRRCVNPDHLEPVTIAENNKRAMRDSCRKGHTWTEESTMIRKDTGARSCRICYRESHREWVARERASRPSGEPRVR